MLKPSLEDFEHNLMSTGDECTFRAWTFFNIVLLGNWDKDWLLPVLWPLLAFLKFLTYWMEHFKASSFRILNSFAGILSPPLALLAAVLFKTHWSSHSRISGSEWETTPLWLSGSLRYFLYSSSVYFFHLLLVYSAVLNHKAPKIKVILRKKNKFRD